MIKKSDCHYGEQKLTEMAGHQLPPVQMEVSSVIDFEKHRGTYLGRGYRSRWRPDQRND